jgi:hypothetical protein
LRGEGLGQAKPFPSLLLGDRLRNSCDWQNFLCKYSSRWHLPPAVVCLQDRL